MGKGMAIKKSMGILGEQAARAAGAHCEQGEARDCGRSRWEGSDTGGHVPIGSCLSIKTQCGCCLHWEVSTCTSRCFHSPLARTTP